MPSVGDPWSRMAWTSPPQDWRVDDAHVATVEARSGTDLWQRTYYGFQRDDGHALLARRSGDFTAELRFDADYEELYDQAGLMLRAGPDRWIKFGVELTDGAPHLSVVVTHGVSDWSARPILLDGPLELRATRLGAAVLLQHGSEVAGWQMARLAPFIEDEVGVGPYLCAPQRTDEMAAFAARFHAFAVTDPLVRELHA